MAGALVRVMFVTDGASHVVCGERVRQTVFYIEKSLSGRLSSYQTPWERSLGELGDGFCDFLGYAGEDFEFFRGSVRELFNVLLKVRRVDS